MLFVNNEGDDRIPHQKGQPLWNLRPGEEVSTYFCGNVIESDSVVDVCWQLSIFT